LKPRLRYVMFSALLLMALAAGCKLGGDTSEANKLIAEANQAIAAADKMSQDAYTKFRTYMKDETIAGFPANREQIRPVAQEAGDLFKKSAATYRDQVINKFEGAGKMGLDEKFKEYITLKTEAYKKLAESKDLAGEMALTPLDPSLTTREEFVAKVREIDARLNAVVKDMDEVNGRANKLQQENPDIIGKPPQ
jgi:hypothetical protein